MIIRPELSIIARCQIHETAKIMPFVNLYDCTIGELAFVGPFCELGGVTIGARTKVSSHSYLCPNVTVGEDCFIAHGVSFVNDKFSDVPKYEDIRDLSKLWTIRATKIGNRVRIGSNAVILPVEIGDDCIIGSGAVVTKPVEPGTTVVGVPARTLRRHLPSPHIPSPAQSDAQEAVRGSG